MNAGFESCSTPPPSCPGCGGALIETRACPPNSKKICRWCGRMCTGSTCMVMRRRSRRAIFNRYSATREEIVERMRDVFGWISRGELKVRVDSVRSLADVAQAHRDLESRRTAGKVLFRVA